MYNRLDSIPACDKRTHRQTDRQTSCHGIVRAMHTRRAVKTYEANHFLEMFPDRGLSFNELKHLTEKLTAVASLTRVRVVIDHTMPTPLRRSTKLKISHCSFDQCLYPIKTSSSVKNILSKCFST